MTEAGRLFIVATPIGNLDDITIRALRTLREADAILAEDTRRTRGLCAHHGVETRIRGFHAHTSDASRERLVEELAGGAKLALVTDAGTPIVSDPGYVLVRDAARAGVTVECIPGASAVTTALCVAGVSCDVFRFVGFLPRSGGKRKRALEAIANDDGATVLFEAPPRLVDTLEDLAALIGAREVAVCRELTKLHEEVARGTASELALSFEGRARGEITIVIAARAADDPREIEVIELDDDALRARAAELRAAGDKPRAIAKRIAEETHAEVKDLYERLTKLRDV